MGRGPAGDPGVVDAAGGTISRSQSASSGTGVGRRWHIDSDDLPLRPRHHYIHDRRNTAAIHPGRSVSFRRRC